MDDKQLQQKELDLKSLESSLQVREADISLRETKASLEFDMSINRQEFFRRAIEVGASSINKLMPFEKRVDQNVIKHLEELIDAAAIKLKDELNYPRLPLIRN